MEGDGHVSNEHEEQTLSSSENEDPSSISTMKISTSPKSLRSPKSPKGNHGKHGSGKGSSLKNDRHSHSRRDGRPKKGSPSL